MSKKPHNLRAVDSPAAEPSLVPPMVGELRQAADLLAQFLDNVGVSIDEGNEETSVGRVQMLCNAFASLHWVADVVEQQTMHPQPEEARAVQLTAMQTLGREVAKRIVHRERTRITIPSEAEFRHAIAYWRSGPFNSNN